MLGFGLGSKIEIFYYEAINRISLSMNWISEFLSAGLSSINMLIPFGHLFQHPTNFSEDECIISSDHLDNKCWYCSPKHEPSFPSIVVQIIIGYQDYQLSPLHPFPPASRSSGLQGIYTSAICTAIVTCDSFQRFAENAAPSLSMGTAFSSNRWRSSQVTIAVHIALV